MQFALFKIALSEAINIKPEDIENKILELNRKMERIRLQCNDPIKDPDFNYLRGVKDGIQIAYGRKIG